jgi:AraC family transcriptional regulator of adaptative response/methylated-DNA-[protein]-cysteine methyltransferase
MNNIKYKIFDSPLGEMVAGATDKGICFLEWEDRGGIERILKRVSKRYKMPTVQVKQNKYIEQLQNELKQYFDGKLEIFEVPLDYTGTKFEQQIWHRLLKIKHGEIKSYGQIAKEVDNPKSVRAVGKANGANYISIVIPCHRVIAANGKLTGYGGKLWRKKYLLELESKNEVLF